ncbi:T9SS type A sorting domain-containing protein [Lacihabitans sp. CS3-21]|uniref:T9SS type A sorting domain-containing protein n=1 Tax=Lacihabitans sp. CS3-21 TaxID=2487332 RepID=UPI0020CD614C|nr:T9SS type A sorting domain-containing protein [Lacihabitans sp. CS3-21]MCP9747193.1 T9SS C-terminal target domain-containing protein [Lacihabitans sp. CS3-21]
MTKFLLVCLFLFSKTALSQEICNQTINLYIDNNTFPNTTKNYIRNVCSGVNLTIGVDSLPNSQIQWYKDEKKIEGATSRQIKTLEGGVYNVKIAHQGCVYYSSLLELVRVKSIRLWVDHSNYRSDSIVGLCKGGVVRLITNIESRLGPQTIQYFKDRERIYSIASITEPGVYYARVTSGECQATSNFVRVINSDSLLIKPDWNPNIRNYMDTVYTCTKTYRIYNEIAGQYSLFKDDVLIKSFDQNQYFTNEITESGKYTFKYTQGECSHTSRPLIFNFGNKASITLLIDTIAFCQDKATLRIQANAYPYDKVGSWYYEETNELIQPNSFVLVPEKTGIYYYRNIDPNCEFVSNKILVNNFKPEFKLRIFGSNGLNQNSVICTGNIVTLISNSLYQPRSYFWTRNGKKINFGEHKFYKIDVSETGTYQLHLDYGFCQYISNEFFIKIDNTANEYTTINLSACNEKTVKLSTVNSPIAKYQWFVNGATLKDQTKSFIEIKPQNSGNYSVQVSSACFEKTVQKLIGVKTTNSLQACVGSRIQINADGVDKKYSWNGPNNFISNSKENSLFINSENQFGTYKVKNFTDTCLFEGTINLTKKVLGKFNLSGLNQVSCETQPYEFNIPRVDSLTYFWNGPNNFISYKNKPIIEKVDFQNTGLYKVIATDISNCSIEDSLRIVVKEYINPSVFVSGGKDFLKNDSLGLFFDLKSYSPWEIQLSNGMVLNPIQSPYKYNLYLEKSETFTVKSVKNICGFGEIKGDAVFNLILNNTEPPNNQFSVFPIPTNGQLSIECNNITEIGVQIFDIHGNRIMNLPNFNTQFQKVDLSKFPTGQYLIQVSSDKEVLSKKIIKI